MAITKTSNLVNVTAFADGVQAKLGDAIKLYDKSFVQDLEEKAGTIVVPKFAYIGDAEEMTEGEAMDISLLTQQADEVNVVQAGKGVEITDKAVNSSYGDALDEAETQVAKAIANKIDADMFKALEDTKLVVEQSAGAFTVEDFFIASALFGENMEEKIFLIMHPKNSSLVRSSKEWRDGAFGDVELEVSNRVPEDTVYLVQEGAVGLYLNKDVEVESQRDVKVKSTIITADAIYGVHLRDESKAVKVTMGTVGE